MSKKTARQIAESEIKQALAKCNKCFIAFGTFVDNEEMLKIVQAALREQREASKPKPKPNFNLSAWTKSIKFTLDDVTYYIERKNGISQVHIFENGIVNPEVIYEEETNPNKCMENFIQYMEDLDIAFEEMGGDWEG